MAEYAGLQIFDENGNTILDTTTYVGRFVGSFNTNGQTTGSFTDTRIIGQRFLHFCPNSSGIYGGPSVTGNTVTGLITWDFNLNTNGTVNVPPSSRELTIIYGVY